MKRISILKKWDLNNTISGTIFILLLIILLSPYLGGSDFGVFKIPIFSTSLINLFKILGPIFILIYIFLIFLIIIEKQDDSSINVNLRSETINSDSKHIIQSTPDIVMHELDKKQINIGEIKRIDAGFNINDLNKRISILNPKLTINEISAATVSARATAFTEKYSAPKEDEKLAPKEALKNFGFEQWETYIDVFAEKIGIDDISNITVLDVGIGNAYASYVFLKKCQNLIGVDISQEALNFAHTKLPHADLKVESAENLKSIKSFTIDLYLSLRTYQSTLFDMKQSLHEAYRVLARGGGIIISIPTIYFSKDNLKRIDGDSYTIGLIPPYSKVPSMEYALEIVNRIQFYLKLLGFSETIVYKDSPYEIFIGGKK